MSARPIIFSAPMVRALLDGQKTQTRRVLKPQPKVPFKNGVWYRPFRDSRQFHFMGRDHLIHGYHDVSYAASDRLWVREGFLPAPMETAPEEPRPTRWNIAYAAGDQSEMLAPAGYNPMLYNYERWSPSIHMPRWASRLTLTVTDVRVQRLQEISGMDAKAEGVSIPAHLPEDGADFDHARRAFAALWNSLHGPDGWAANPWVVALTFTVERRNIDTEGAA